jgi:hypothetical protein
MYARERAEATQRRGYSEKPQDLATVQASFLDLAELVTRGVGPPGSGKRRAKRVDTSMRQMTFADICEAWQ